MMNKFQQILSLIVVLNLAACASVPMANKDDDSSAKKFAVLSGQSRIYVYRNEALGAAIKISLALDGKMMGQTAKNVYYAWDVSPGNHEISCFAESNSKINITAKPGKSVFVWQEMKMGFMSAGCDLHEVDAVTGQKEVADCDRAQSN